MRRLRSGEAHEGYVLQEFLASQSEVNRVFRFARNGQDLSRPPFRTRRMCDSIADSEWHVWPYYDERLSVLSAAKQFGARRTQFDRSGRTPALPASRADGAGSIELRPNGGHLDTVFADLAESDVFGMLAIEFATQRRMRANGVASVAKPVITLSTAEVYSNCPQYIAPRNDRIELGAAAMHSTDSLTESQRRMIAAASTFFIASAHPEAGADASHRGGAPGFIRVEGDTISWPDYRGNNMFNTIGNLLVNPKCGLLFIDFESGASLQIEGSASVQWEEAGTRIEVSVKRIHA